MAAVGSLENALVSVILDELRSQRVVSSAKLHGFSSKLKKIEKTVIMTQARLVDAEEKIWTDGRVKTWLDNLRNVLYDFEDFLDELATDMLMKADQSPTKRVRKCVPSCFNLFGLSSINYNHRKSSEIEALRSRLGGLCKIGVELGLLKISGGLASSAAACQLRPPTTHLQNEVDVLGRDGDKIKILDLIMGDEPLDLRVVAISGMGGLGKTTLAQLLYEDQAVEAYFERRSWVCVSEYFDVLRISKDILESITLSSCYLDDLDLVQKLLKEAVAGRKFLLVLDDVWNTNSKLWETFKAPLSAGAPGSVILVTTRLSDVALAVGATDVYNLGLLSEDVCWSLFVKCAAVEASHAGEAGNLELIREKVVKKCAGLPLAARTLGGLLCSVPRDDAWGNILNSKIWDLSEHGNHVPPVLKLSYHYLPSHLKRCFAYCAIFPKDYQFAEKEVVLLWMAEGFLVQTNGNRQMEDVGCEYFQDLVSRSIFQPSSQVPFKFIMHDLVHDLAIWAAGQTSFMLDEELGFKKLFGKSCGMRHFSYVSTRCDGINKFDVLGEAKNLRTFLPIHFVDETKYLTNVVPSVLLSKLKKLRVLSLKNIYIEELPDSVGDLILLRYLNLSHTEITHLPESTGLLGNLQTLLLTQCFRLKKLPLHMGNLIKLRHLDIVGVPLTEMPLGMKNLKDLQELTNFIVGKGVGSCINDIKNLKFLHGKLHISGLENVVLGQNTTELVLVGMESLEVLLLEWVYEFDDSRSEDMEKDVLEKLQPHENLKELTIKCYGGTSFPSWVGNLAFSNTVVVRLESCEKCKFLPPLGLLRSLKDLTIRGMNALKTIGFEIYGADYSQSFPSLKTLHLEEMQEWENWELIQENGLLKSFPCLQELFISDCPKFIGRLPDRHSSLEKLVILECPQLVVSISHLASLEKLTVHKCAELEVLCSYLPSLCELDIHGLERMGCRTPINFQSLKSVKLSNIPYFRSGLFQRYQEYAIVKIVDYEDLLYLLANERCIENPLYGLHSFSSLNELHIEDCRRSSPFPKFNHLSNLTKLEFVNCNAVRTLPAEIKHCKRLESLRFERCHALTCILRGQLPSSLKQLSVYNCKELLCLLDDISSSGTLLENLYISYCPSLKCLSSSNELPATLRKFGIQDCQEITTLSAIGHLPKALQHFSVTNCPKLESIAESSNNVLLESMLIRDCRALISITSSLQNVTRLQEIYILDCPKVVSFPEVGLHNKNLKVMSIMRCRKISALPYSFHTLDSIQELVLHQCPSIISFPKGGFPTNITSISITGHNICKPLFKWGLDNLRSLKVLEIRECHDVISFPQEEIGMSLPATIAQLTIQGFINLSHLSSPGFQKLINLENLSISDCPNLVSFPTEGFPSSLLQLCLSGCPLLEELCQKDDRAEWLKISHIPRIRIGG